jgi:CheY-like chemotaxis protein
LTESAEMTSGKLFQAPASKPATILCIDDEEPGLLVRKALLESAGHRVLTALSGSEGLRLFNSEPIDAVIVDYWMAGKNGLAVARELKRVNRAIPIIMLSAYVSLPDETIGVVDLWVQKGGDSQYLLDSLEQLLKARLNKGEEKRSSC